MKFSIIVAAYNAEKEIARTIESVLAQTYKDFELIVVNDASTDSTAEIVSQFEDVILLNNEKNIKAGGSRNRGLEKASGEYIVFLDSDDILTSNTVLELLANKIEEKGATDVIYFGMKSHDGVRELIPNEHNSIKENRLLEWNYANVCDVCWKKSFLDTNNIRFAEERFFEDFPFYYKGLICSKTYNYLEYPVITYTRQRPDSMTTKINIKKIQDYYYNMILLTEIYLNAEEKYMGGLFHAIVEQHRNLDFYLSKMSGNNK